jgi:pimeloyl-ACP methyl ester carboxylesterase
MVLGEHDQMTHRKSAMVLAEKLRATVHTLQSGHALMQEQPDAVLNILKRALA